MFANKSAIEGDVIVGAQNFAALEAESVELSPPISLQE